VVPSPENVKSAVAHGLAMGAPEYAKWIERKGVGAIVSIVRETDVVAPF